MQTIAIMALDEGHKRQQHSDHSQAAEDPLIPHNLQRLYVQVCHEVVLKGDLGGLHTLQHSSMYSGPARVWYGGQQQQAPRGVNSSRFL